MPNDHTGQVTLYFVYRLRVKGVFYDKRRSVHFAVRCGRYRHSKLAAGHNRLIGEPHLKAGVIVDKTGGHGLTVLSPE